MPSASTLSTEATRRRRFFPKINSREDGFITIESAGINPAAITASRDAFRAAVGGGAVAGANGSFGGDLTRMEFFDEHNALIFTRNVLAGGNQGLSFVGGVANAGERISRVRLTAGLNTIVSNGCWATRLTT
ncbi:MAG: hypothetical protein V4631_01200 [Pseudomonadota bacterium]